jgi:hypothetical protein
MGFDGTACADELAARIYPKPKRIQSKARTKGWHKPPNTVIVTRPGRYGNHPAKRLGIKDRVKAVAEYRRWLNEDATLEWKQRARIELRSKDLACSCPLDDQPCHADLLLELANGPRWWWPTRAERLTVLRAMHSLVRKHPDRYALGGGKGRTPLSIGTHKAIAKLEAN